MAVSNDFGAHVLFLEASAGPRGPPGQRRSSRSRSAKAGGSSGPSTGGTVGRWAPLPPRMSPAPTALSNAGRWQKAGWPSVRTGIRCPTCTPPLGAARGQTQRRKWRMEAGRKPAQPSLCYAGAAALCWASGHSRARPGQGGAGPAGRGARARNWARFGYLAVRARGGHVSRHWGASGKKCRTSLQNRARHEAAIPSRKYSELSKKGNEIIAGHFDPQGTKKPQ